MAAVILAQNMHCFLNGHKQIDDMFKNCVSSASHNSSRTPIRKCLVQTLYQYLNFVLLRCRWESSWSDVFVHCLQHLQTEGVHTEPTLHGAQPAMVSIVYSWRQDHKMESLLLLDTLWFENVGHFVSGPMYWNVVYVLPWSLLLLVL